jgi:hypothetical protein
MVSFWWVLAAFIGGGCAGVLVMALMCFAGGLPEQTDVRERRSRSTLREGMKNERRCRNSCI